MRDKETPEAERRLIAKSARRAWRMLALESVGLDKGVEVLKSGKKAVFSEDEALFAWLKWIGKSALADARFVQAIRNRVTTPLTAAEEKFFIRLGRAIGCALKQQEPIKQQWKELKVFLVGGWLKLPPEAEMPGIGFCDYTDEALAEFFATRLPGCEELTSEALCKIRQRLGLKKARVLRVREFTTRRFEDGKLKAAFRVDKLAH